MVRNILTSLTAAFIFYRKVLKAPVCRICDAIRNFFTVGSKVADMEHKIEFVFQECKPNGGQSIKDAIKRIEDNQILLMNKNRIILDDYHTAIVETNAEGLITWANSTYLELTDRELRDILGNGWVNAIAPEFRDEVFADWQEALEQERNYEGYFEIQKPNGKRVKVHGTAIPTKDAEHIRGYIGKVKIIMEEK